MERNTDSERQHSTTTLREAGASDAFISLYLSDTGDRRNHVRQELDEGYGGQVLERGDDPSDVAGSFFTALWEGDVFDAFRRADGNNTPVMVEMFSEDGIIHAGIQNGYDPDYVERLVTDKVERVA